MTDSEPQTTLVVERPGPFSTGDTSLEVPSEIAERTGPEPTVMGVSSIENPYHACSLMGIFNKEKDNYINYSKYLFEMPSVEGKGKAPRGTPFSNDVRQSLNWSTIWFYSEESDGYLRMWMDIILFDRLEHVQQTLDNFGLRKLQVQAEYPCSAPTTDPRYIFNGKIDYAIGSGTPSGGLDSVLVAVTTNGDPEQAQIELFCYLGAVQRTRKAEGKTITIVYGIAVGYYFYHFFRLDEECNLLESKDLFMRNEREEIYHWIDSILIAAAYACPHTIPAKARRFPRTLAVFKENIERPLFENAETTVADIDDWIQRASDADVVVAEFDGTPV